MTGLLPLPPAEGQPSPVAAARHDASPGAGTTRRVCVRCTHTWSDHDVLDRVCWGSGDPAHPCLCRRYREEGD